jgi:signal-transduction protein with cAMP-binding, CBS, and nucleotidyltransferase domain
MKTIRHILEQKGKFIWSIRPEEFVYDALTLMAKKDVGALLVMENDQLVGIISERDYARKIILLGRTSRETKVSEIMSSPVFTIHPDSTIEEAMEMMTRHRVRHLPVSEDNLRVIGVISIGDVLNSLIYFQRQIIRRLEECSDKQRETIAELEQNLGASGDFRSKFERLDAIIRPQINGNTGQD